jgi:hypothetical protein
LQRRAVRPLRGRDPFALLENTGEKAGSAWGGDSAGSRGLNETHAELIE